MSDKTGIEWTEATWNPVTGCTKTSPGCKHCYAEREWGRLSANPKSIYFGREFTDVQCHPDRLWKNSPGTWTKPRKVFVCSMSDLFHEAVPFGFIDEVFEVINCSPDHQFQILTKRPERMLECFTRPDAWQAGMDHVWLGVSIEDRKHGLPRLDILRKVPAEVRFLSIEPLLEDLGAIDLNGIHWVIVGGESGTKARPMHPAWVRSIRDQCVAADVPFLFKQWGEWVPRSSCYHTFEDGKSCADLDPGAVKWPCIRLTEGGYDGRNLANVDGGCDAYMQRTGKKMAGRLLDGVLHDGYPGQRPASMSELVEWHLATKELPDADITVMTIVGGEVEAWPGYWDGDQWRNADGMPAGKVIYWADMLEGPLP